MVTPGLRDAPPSDAVVLFDGDGLDGWTRPDGQPAGWSVKDGVLGVVPGTGSILSRQTFGSAQIHLEFATPAEATGESQGRGNSGVYVQGRYEVQILDSYRNETYPDGQCGAIYGQHPPLVNASRAPGEWQTYDIVFRAARFADDGTRVAPATMTVFHNGVLIHDRATVTGATTAALAAEGADDGPLYLQDHGNPVRFRNIWVRRLR